MRNRQCLCGFARFAYNAPSALTDLDCSYRAETANKPPINFGANYRIVQDDPRRWPGRKQKETNQNRSVIRSAVHPT